MQLGVFHSYILKLTATLMTILMFSKLLPMTLPLTFIELLTFIVILHFLHNRSGIQLKICHGRIK